MKRKENLCMKCPNCRREMTSALEFKSFYHWEDEETYWYKDTVYKCPSCNIEYEYKKGKWTIPTELKPTEKQINTVMFITTKLPHLSCECLTKSQCWDFIHQNFALAKKIRPSYPTEEDLEQYGYDISMFY